MPKKRKEAQEPEEKEEDKEVDLTEQSALELVKKFYDTHSPLLSRFKSKLNVYYMLYRGKTTRRSYKGLANVSVPEIFRSIETLVANVYAMLFPEDPFFVAQAPSEERADYAKKTEWLITKQLAIMQFQRKMIQILRKAAIEGIVFPGLFWKEVIKILPFVKTEEGKTRENVKTTVYDNPDLRIPSTIDIVLDPFGDPSTGIMEIRTVNWEELREMEKAEIVYDINRVKELEDKGGETERTIKQKRKQSTGFSTDEKTKKEGRYTLYDFWGRIPKKWVDKETEDEEEMIDGNVIICNDIILGIRQNPYWLQEIPYISCPWIEIDNEFFGIGAAEIGEKLQGELNDSRNQFLDHKTFTLYNIWLKQRSANIKNSDLKIKPNAIIETDDINGIKDIRPNPAAFAEGVQTENIVKDDIRNALGATSTLQGVALTKRQTQGEINLLAAQGGSRLRLIATTIAEVFLKPFLRQLYWLDQQNVTTEQKIKMIGAQGVTYDTLKPDEIYGELDFIPKVMTDADNRQTQRMELLNMLQIVAPMPPDSPFWGLIRKIYENLGFKDANEILPTPPREAWKYHIQPEKEHDLFDMGGFHRPWKFEDHNKHNEAHVAYRRELVEKAETDEKARNTIELLDRHIREHFEYAGVLPPQEAPLGMVAPTPTGAGGIAPPVPPGGLIR